MKDDFEWVVHYKLLFDLQWLCVRNTLYLFKYNRVCLLQILNSSSDIDLKSDMDRKIE